MSNWIVFGRNISERNVYFLREGFIFVIKLLIYFIFIVI